MINPIIFLTTHKAKNATGCDVSLYHKRPWKLREWQWYFGFWNNIYIYVTMQIYSAQLQPSLERWSTRRERERDETFQPISQAIFIFDAVRFLPGEIFVAGKSVSPWGTHDSDYWAKRPINKTYKIITIEFISLNRKMRRSHGFWKTSLANNLSD